MERCACTALTMVRFGGVVQWCPSDGRVMMDSRREVALSGAVVSSTTGLARSMRQYQL